MTQSDHSARRTPPRAPARRGDSTRPTRTRPSTRTGSRSITRRGGDRRPYPTASTTTRVSSPAKPGSAGGRTRSRGSSSVPIPATVWPAGPAPIDLDAAWPAAVVSKIVSSFSEPGGRVALVPWPTQEPTSSNRPRLAPVGPDGVIDSPIATPPGAEPDDDMGTELSAALAAVEGLGRAGRVVRLVSDPTGPTDTGPGSRPFWADLLASPDPATGSSAARSGVSESAPDRSHAASTDDINSTDLIITSLRPEHHDLAGDRASDRVALFAARLLRVGGILAVLTHSDWPLGELIDPTGAVVASAQNADLLYLQHIVALHTPVRDGRFATETHTESHVESRAEFRTGSLAEPISAAVEELARVRHRAAVRGLPTPHQRIHSDVLVFAQPHEYEPPRLAAADAAFDTGVIR